MLERITLRNVPPRRAKRFLRSVHDAADSLYSSKPTVGRPRRPPRVQHVREQAAVQVLCVALTSGVGCRVQASGNWEEEEFNRTLMNFRSQKD